LINTSLEEVSILLDKNNFSVYTNFIASLPMWRSTTLCKKEKRTVFDPSFSNVRVHRVIKFGPGTLSLLPCYCKNLLYIEKSNQSSDMTYLHNSLRVVINWRQNEFPIQRITMDTVYVWILFPSSLIQTLNFLNMEIYLWENYEHVNLRVVRD